MWSTYSPYEVTTMIAMTNLTKKTALGGTALFLVLLMTLMPMSGFVDNPLQSEQVTAMPETTVDQDDFGAHETLLSEYPDDWELLGMRTETSRTYVLETGEFAVLTLHQADPLQGLGRCLAEDRSEPPSHEHRLGGRIELLHDGVRRQHGLRTVDPSRTWCR